MIENYESWMDAVIFVAVVLGVALPWLWWWGRRIDRRRGVPSCVEQPRHVKLIEPEMPPQTLPWPLDLADDSEVPA